MCGNDSCSNDSCEKESCGESSCCSDQTFVEHVKMEATNAIHQAHKDALKDRMRKKIEEKHGTTLDKVADVCFEAFEKAFKTMTIKSKEKTELNVKLEEIFSQKD